MAFRSQNPGFSSGFREIGILGRCSDFEVYVDLRRSMLMNYFCETIRLGTH